MGVYILMWLMIVSFFLLRDKKYSISPNKSTEKHNNCIFTFIMCLLLFVSAFRAEHIGADHINYITEFNVIKDFGDTYFEEKGYVLFNRIIAAIFNDSVFLMVSVSGLIIFSVTHYIKENVNYEYYALALMVFVFQPYLYIQSTFNILRQGCATAILLFSIHYLFNKKWVKYMVIGCIACTFHLSMVFIIFFLIIVRKINATPQLIRFFAIGSLMMNFAKIGNLFFSLFSSHYQTFSSFDETLFNNPIYLVAILSVVFYFTSIYSKLYKNVYEKFFVDLFLMSLVFLIFAVQNDILYRVYIVLAFCTIPSITIICKNLAEVAFVKRGFVIYYNFFYLGNIFFWYINKIRGYVPYEFIF